MGGAKSDKRLAYIGAVVFGTLEAPLKSIDVLFDWLGSRPKDEKDTFEGRCNWTAPDGSLCRIDRSEPGSTLK